MTKPSLAYPPTLLNNSENPLQVEFTWWKTIRHALTVGWNSTSRALHNISSLARPGNRQLCGIESLQQSWQRYHDKHLNQLKQQCNRTTADNNTQQASGLAHNTSDLPDSIGVDNTAGPSNSASGPFKFAALPWTDGNPNMVDNNLDSVHKPDDMKVEYHLKTKIPAKIY
ncbi:hypothetical protein EW026_g8315 [Hermanssonia centrifuga]|uniref:Uncharacterized protein n=1 Tax=Hermanssonia centrifuga TaxID=98765 RepID=A0A4S4K4K0_9APHY|nr:hypothetical protein EW026_g8315 [Hermanssonia centrifuga]